MADLDFVAITRWLSSSEFLWIALVITAVIVTLKIASRLLEAGLAA